MEKQRTKCRQKFSRGLLTAFILLFITPLHAKILTNKDFSSLTFNPILNENEKEFYTNTDIRFEVIIPYVRPSEIEIISPDDYDNATFKTLKRTELEGEDAGTRIEVWYSFSKKGEYTLRPLSMRVQGFRRSVSYAPIFINTNPKDLEPIVYLKFSDGTITTSEDGFSTLSNISAKAGQKISFDVLFQYGVQLLGFNWLLPKDSIFSQISEGDILSTKYNDKSKIEQIVKIASFEWLPLLEGTATFPVFSISVTNNNGVKREILTPSVTINILGKVESSEQKEETLFSDAFSQTQTEKVVVEEKIITKEDCTEVAKLRIKERYGLFGIGKKGRIEKERELGLASNKNEFSFAWIYLAICCVVASICCFIVFLRKKRIITNIVTSACIVVSLVGLCICLIEAKKPHGVSYGCQLYSIPDDLSEAKTELKPGSYVQIIETSGEWFYVLLGEAGGWCKKDGIVLIK